MQYAGDMAAIQQRLAQCSDMVARRIAVLDALQAVPGWHVMEIGCGGGFYTREIGLAVGEAGTATGVDISEDQISAARERNRDVENVSVRVGDVRKLDAPDGHFDAVVSVQVLEYVDDLSAALGEMHRVLKVGGRFVNLATNWHSVFWSGTDADLTSRVLSAWDAHAVLPNLPVILPGDLLGAGFGNVHQSGAPVINSAYHPNTFSYWLAKLIVPFVVGKGLIPEHDGNRWLGSLEEAQADGTYFFSSVPIITSATRTG